MLTNAPYPPRFSISVVAESPAHTIRSAEAAEANDFDMIFVGDIQSTHRELYTSLTLIALHTSRIVLGPGVTNPVTRHPAVTAGAIATLDDISSGRGFLVVRPGGRAVHSVGEKPATLAETEEALRCIQALWRDGSTTYRGKHVNGRKWRTDMPVL